MPGLAAHTGSTALPSTTVPASSEAAASAELSSRQSTEHKANTEELPLWVETKTAEGKVS